MMNRMNTIVEALGYSDSKNYFTYEALKNNEAFDFHWQKVFSLIKPDALYAVEKTPLILFYEEGKVIDFKAIWNAQVPFVFVLKEDTVYVYNGKKWIEDDKELEQLEMKALKDIDSVSFSYWDLNDERFLSRYSKELSDDQLNESLLQNIKTLTNKLKVEFEIPFATKLVLRIIFTRFLIDRGVNLGYKNFTSNIDQSRDEFLNLLKSKDDLYDLFKHLKEKFNGNLFELGDEESSEKLKSTVFEMLRSFISGDLVLERGQMSLFPLYDFNIISVELISNIYEILLGHEGQKQNKSFYTPSYLVDYVLSKTIELNLGEKESCKVFDPSCGSGIFLVKAYRKVIEKQLKSHQDKSLDDILIDALKNNIYGVDLSAEAIYVTIFSLYLTVLDYKNPKELEHFKLPDLLNSNLFISDFFDENLKEKLSEITFDYVLGNPPWGGITGKRKEISQDFVFELSNYLSEDTTCSLVLPSKLLYNHQDSFKKLREFLLTENLLAEVLELSPVRKEVFKNAKAPAVILTYKKSSMHSEQTLKNKFTHISLKPNIYFELFDILAIEKNDIKFVKQDLLFKNDWAWKTLLYGTSWDLDICIRLQEQYKTIKATGEKINRDCNDEKIIFGTGIRIDDGKEDSSSYIGRPLLNSKTGMSRFSLNLENSIAFDKATIHRRRRKQLFEGARCLVKKGPDAKNYSLKSIYTEKSFLFKDAIGAIKGDDEYKAFLKSITGLFNSSFSSYINTLLGSSIGTEREQVLFEEALNFPFFNNEEIVYKISLLVDKMQNIEMKNMPLSDSILENEKQLLTKELNDIVLQGFELKGNPFVDYVLNVIIPMTRREKSQLGNKKVTEPQLAEYAQEFQEYFINTYASHGYGIEIKFSTNIINQFVAFELIINENSNDNSIDFIQDNHSEKELISRFAIKSHTDSFITIRDSIVFEDTSFYILKKDLFKNWHPAMAKRDLAEVIDRILAGGGR